MRRIFKRLVSFLTGEGDYLWRVERLDLTPRPQTQMWTRWEEIRWEFPDANGWSS